MSPLLRLPAAAPVAKAEKAAPAPVAKAAPAPTPKAEAKPLPAMTGRQPGERALASPSRAQPRP